MRPETSTTTPTTTTTHVESSAGTGLTPSGDSSTGQNSPTWRSSLYPQDWMPGARDDEGRGLPDFSYAGYRNGETPPTPPWPQLSVLDFGADPRGTTPTDDAFAAALEAAPDSGAIVYLPAGRYRFDGRLTIARNNIVVRGDGPQHTFLRFTRAEGMSHRGHIEAAGMLFSGPEGFLMADGHRDASRVRLADVTSFEPGEQVLVGWNVTEAFAASYGMEDTWADRVGDWKPFFRRTIRSVDETTDELVLDVPLRHDALIRDGASVRPVQGYLREVGLEGFSIANATDPDEAWAHTQVAAIELRHVRDSWIRDVHSFEVGPEQAHLQSKGISVVASVRVSVLGSVMESPQHRGEGGNGYLFEVSQSSEVLFADVAARNGRHNLIQNWEFGTSGCVFLRCRSEGSVAYLRKDTPSPLPAYSEFHHSLAMANLIDSCEFDDGWSAINRGLWSSGSGVTATENVFWNPSGSGRISSKQAGHGYVIATAEVDVDVGLRGPHFFPQDMTAPEDFVETVPEGAELVPGSLYDDQRARRLGSASEP